MSLLLGDVVRIQRVQRFHYKKFLHYTSVTNPVRLSRIRLFPIPDPGSEFFPSRIHIKEFKYFNPKKWFLSSRKYDPDCSSRSRLSLPIPDPGSRGSKRPRIRIGSIALHAFLFSDHRPRSLLPGLWALYPRTKDPRWKATRRPVPRYQSRRRRSTPWDKNSRC